MGCGHHLFIVCLLTNSNIINHKPWKVIEIRKKVMIILLLESPSTQTISLKTKLKRMLSIYCPLMLPFDKFYLRRLSVTMDFVIYNDNMVNYESSQFVTSCK